MLSGAIASARAAIAADDLDSFRGVEVPFLVVVAESSGPFIPAVWEPLMIAHRAGLWRDLRALARRRPALRLRGVDASHGLIQEAPRESARLVSEFLAEAGAAR